MPLPSRSDPLTPAANTSGTPFLRDLPVELRPDRSLLRYNILASLLLGPFFIFGLAPLYFRFRSLRYIVDAEGISMRWGILFRREISLTYARIQDIHLSSNFVERWLGLARIQVQTASGSATAEMTIEGVRDYEAMRDFLYARMRGARDPSLQASGRKSSGSGSDADELASTLRAVATEMRVIREALQASAPARPRDV